MTLRRKTIMVVGAVLIALVSLQFIASKLILQRGFKSLETSHSQQNVNQVTEAIANEISYYQKKILDYSMWDDTYKFIEDGNKEYIKSNLVEATFEGLNVNFMAFVDSKGRVVYSMGFDHDKLQLVPISKGITDRIINNKLFRKVNDSRPESGIQGIVILPEGPMMTVSRPILKSNGDGPRKGTVIAGRYLDNTEKKHISDVTRLSISINNYINIKNKSDDFYKVKQLLAESNGIIIRPINRNRIAGYTEIKDVYGRNALILRVDMERDINKQGRQSMLFFTISLLAVGVVIIIMLIVLLEKMVLSRISSLSVAVENIGSNKDLSQRIYLDGEDELSNLAKEANIMLDALQKTEKELRESEHRYRHLFESLIDGFAYFRVIQDESGRVLDYIFLEANDSFKRIHGLNSDVLKGKRVSKIKGDVRDLLTWCEGTDNKELVTGDKLNYIYFSEHTLKWYMATAYSPAKGYYITLFHDITERKNNEEELQRAKEAAEFANQSKSQFLATMSHEIRTPMNAILGMSELLLDTSLDLRQRDLISTICDSGSLLLNIINDVLDFSKIEANKLILENYEFDLLKVVEDVAEFIAVKAREKGISLMTFISPDIPLVIGDAQRLKQVLLNLAGNAIKFTEEGEVLIRAAVEDFNDKTVSILFEVKDTGIGIAEDSQSKLFEPFVQSDGSTTRKYGGTGLGLSITKQLVNMMNGEIGIISSPGQGSSFVFNVRLGVAGDRPRNSSSISEIEGLSALIINDSRIGADILQNYFTSWGIRNLRVSSIDEAISTLLKKAEENEPFDMVIADFTAWNYNAALELADIIKGDSKVSKTKIFLTAPDWENGGNIIAAGFSACITKPVRQSQVMDCIANAFGNEEESASANQDGYIGQKAAGTIAADSCNCANTVLIVEDNPVNRKLAVMQFEKLGISVSIANNGQEAVDYLKANQCKLIFMDCQMPVMDGFEATKQIRKQEASLGRHTTIIAMTANAMQGDQEKCIASGMDDYISKPVNIQKLKEKLEKWKVINETADSE
ncbi:MAG TPA: CHASE4 domain-containing protein [Clostridia bacterium]|nr:CHASE4 domain-containing protein [Clostridia bacterium]